METPTEYSDIRLRHKTPTEDSDRWLRQKTPTEDSDRRPRHKTPCACHNFKMPENSMTTACRYSCNVTACQKLDASLMRSWCDLDATLCDEKHHSEGVSEAKKSQKYMFSTQNCFVSSKKASFWMKTIILRVYQKLTSSKNTSFRRKFSRSLRKKHPFGWKISFWGCIKS